MKRIVYVQVVDMTDDEKIAMYMKYKKIDLAKMLLNANKVLDMLCKRAEPERCEFDGIHQITGDMEGCSSSTAVYWTGSGDVDEEIKPGVNCDRLCLDCRHCSYCWDSEYNENKNS